MQFTDRLYDKVKPIWQKNHQHPFVQGIGFQNTYLDLKSKSPEEVLTLIVYFPSPIFPEIL
jgi:hypothetical protein